MKDKKNHLKSVSWIIGMMIGVTAIALGWVMSHRDKVERLPIKIAGFVLPTVQPVAPFKLTDTQGHLFSEKELQQHWTMMFFGFTNCGMVCPTTMAALKNMYHQLQQRLPLDQLPQVVMVTVDPARDTLQRLNDYVKTFDSHFMGARGEISETVALEAALHIAAAKIQASGQSKNQYTIDHSSEILLFNPQGELYAYLSWPHDAHQLSKDYLAILNSSVRPS